MPRFQLFEGDAYDVLDKLAPASADLVYTSPAPAFYEKQRGETDPNILGTEQDTFRYMQHLLAILEKVIRVIKPKGSLWIQIADYHHCSGTVMMVPEQIALNLLQKGWLLISPIIWSRGDRAVNVGGNNRRFLKDWEYLYWFVRSSDYYFNEDCGINRTSVFDYPYVKPERSSFVSGYPVELVDIAIKSTCPENGTVLDPFAGTGTTGVSALKNKRFFVGIEIDPILIPKIEKRLSNL